MQSFTNIQAAIESLPGCSIAIEAEEPLHTALTGMVQELGCHPIRLPPGARALYHASGSFASSFLVALLNDAITLWSAFGVGRETALRALLPLMKGTVAAIEANGPVRSLAGPIARADVGTVERHLAALGEKAPALLATYLDLARRSLPIAEVKGGADRAKLERLRLLLERAAGPSTTRPGMLGDPQIEAWLAFFRRDRADCGSGRPTTCIARTSRNVYISAILPASVTWGTATACISRLSLCTR